MAIFNNNLNFVIKEQGKKWNSCIILYAIKGLNESQKCIIHAIHMKYSLDKIVLLKIIWSLKKFYEMNLNFTKYAYDPIFSPEKIVVPNLNFTT